MSKKKASHFYFTVTSANVDQYPIFSLLKSVISPQRLNSGPSNLGLLFQTRDNHRQTETVGNAIAALHSVSADKYYVIAIPDVT